MDVKKIYWYYDGNNIVSSHDIPKHGTMYVEKTINTIGIPDLRAVSIKNNEGKLLYNNLENIPLEDNVIEKYLTGAMPHDESNK
jgi:hypothetical protein